VEVKARLGGLQRSKIDSPPIMYTQNGDALSLLGNITEKGSRSGSSAISREPQNELVATRVSLTSEILFSYFSQYRSSLRPTHTTDGGEVTTVKYSTVPTHDTRPRDHPNHYLGRVRPTGVDPFSLLGDTGTHGSERSDSLPTHMETPPKHGFLDRSDLPSVRQLPVSWLSTQQAAKCQLSMGTQRRGGASHLPDQPSTPSSRSARKSRR
jgi:hypothetical protein